MEFKQVGPGHVLNGLVKTIQRDSESLVVAEPEFIDLHAEPSVGIKAAVQAPVEAEPQPGTCR
ncbi:hypothetical protein [Paenibacillus sp. S150]|uniref:hypothetical protein n=1 Tax=Paenibacillus sp. S150 TaxID=2749826 RepID=UPI001C5A3BCA|nr:hypothetical protein [Paenibacillus sp. S150]MBW4080624.1 hypothetical protein [Paenibacillus sp. S150]